jgi:hypothetical protein
MLFTVHTVVNAQELRGKIMDQESGQSIPNAAVYITGTFLGATADHDGRFSIDISRFPQRPVTVSAIGYYSSTVTRPHKDTRVPIYLVPKVYELEGASVTTRSLARKRRINLAAFKKEFLGSSAYARESEIINEEVIRFNYQTDRDTLLAYALEPLRIHNRALGYYITYYLNHFEYDRRTKTTLFMGDILFDEDLNIVSENERRFERRRQYVYKGSCMHFFRILWADQLDDSPFRVLNTAGYRLQIDELVAETEEGVKYMVDSGNLEVCYYQECSEVEFLDEAVYFDRTGYYDPTAILWRGPMAEERVGDWLPYEYTDLP